MKKYDGVIFDEMGLICHFYMALTTKKAIQDVLEAMRQLIVEAKLVVLVQDFFTHDKVAFSPCQRGLIQMTEDISMPGA